MIFDAEAVHLVWGDSAACSLRTAFKLRRNQMIVCRDNLSIGRQLLTSDVTSWCNVRWHVLAEMFGAQTVEEWRSHFGENPISNFDLLDSDKAVFQWVDGHLGTQLLMAFVNFLFEAKGWDIERLHVIEYRYRSEHDVCVSIPAMSIEMLTEHRPTTRKIGKSDHSKYVRIWRHYCSALPAVHSKLVSDPVIAELSLGALRYIARRYPNRSTGLDEIDSNLLRHAVEHAPSTLRTIGSTMGYDETPDLCGDDYLFKRLLLMSAGRALHPLVEFSGDTSHMRSCSFKVLPLANEILSGKKNMVELNGIDQWIGGVHLTPENLVWRDEIETAGKQ